MNTTTAPQLREGSTGGKAVRYLQLNGGEATQADLLKAIELDEDDAGMLGYARRLGVLVCEERGGVTYWRLGEGKPAEPPTPSREPEIPVFVGKASAQRRRWPGGLTTEHGSAVHKMLCCLEEHAPAGSDRWLLSRTLAHAADTEPKQIYAMLKPALQCGAVNRSMQDTYMVWQLGTGIRAVGMAAPAPKAEAPEAAPPAAKHPEDALLDEAFKAHMGDQKFRCGIFSDGVVTITKGHSLVELDPDEALIVFEHLSAARRLGEAAK